MEGSPVQVPYDSGRCGARNGDFNYVLDPAEVWANPYAATGGVGSPP